MGVAPAARPDRSAAVTPSCQPLKRRLHRQFMNAERVAQDGGVLVCRLGDVGPDDDVAAEAELAAARRHARVRIPHQHGLEAVDQLGATAPVDEVSNQSPTLTLNAACAAASLATGTRYGEQLT